MYLMRNHDVWIYVRCANSDPRIAFDRLYDLIDEAAGHGFLVRGTSFDHCSGNTLKDRIGLRSILCPAGRTEWSCQLLPQPYGKTMPHDFSGRDEANCTCRIRSTT